MQSNAASDLVLNAKVAEFVFPPGMRELNVLTYDVGDYSIADDPAYNTVLLQNDLTVIELINKSGMLRLLGKKLVILVGTNIEDYDGDAFPLVGPVAGGIIDATIGSTLDITLCGIPTLTFLLADSTTNLILRDFIAAPEVPA